MTNRQAIINWLDAEGIRYTLVEHAPAYDMEDIVAMGIDTHGPVAKNLFLRDSRKGKHHWNVTVLGDARVDLVKLGEAIGERLSFASEERLERYLHLKKGEVTPLGVFFDTENAVEVLFYSRLEGCEVIGVHPCDISATVFIAFDDLKRCLERCGNAVGMITLP